MREILVEVWNQPVLRVLFVIALSIGACVGVLACSYYTQLATRWVRSRRLGRKT